LLKKPSVIGLLLLLLSFPVQLVCGESC